MVNCESVEKYFHWKNMGINDAIEREKNCILKNINDCVKFDNNRYEVELPYFQYPPNIESSCG